MRDESQLELSLEAIRREWLSNDSIMTMKLCHAADFLQDSFCYFSFQRKIILILFQFCQFFIFNRILPEYRFHIEKFLVLSILRKRKVILKSSEGFNSIWVYRMWRHMRRNEEEIFMRFVGVCVYVVGLNAILPSPSSWRMKWEKDERKDFDLKVIHQISKKFNDALWLNVDVSRIASVDKKLHNHKLKVNLYVNP